MFDVVWADPQRELVGQRKARRELEKKEAVDSSQDEGRRSGQSSSRSAASVRSGSSSQSRKPSSFLEALRRKKRDKSATEPTVSAPPPSSGSAAATKGKRQRASLPAVVPSSSSNSSGYPDRYGDAPNSAQNRSSLDDSILTKWTAPLSLTTMLSVDEEPRLGLGMADEEEGSRQPQEEEERPGWPRAAAAAAAAARPARAARAADPLPEMTPAVWPAARKTDSRDRGSISHHPLSSPPPLPHWQPSTPLRRTSLMSPSPQSPSSPATVQKIKAPSNRVQFRTQADMPSPQMHSAVPASWLPPESWHCIKPPANMPPAGILVRPGHVSSSSSATSATSPTSASWSRSTDVSMATSPDDESISLSLDFSGMQREILHMTEASPETFLRRLTEEWGTAADAALYKELEMEKKRWLLSALYSINPATDIGITRVLRTDRRILAFFESHATTSYIAAVNVGIPVHHMSPSPLTSRLFPNIWPIVSASVPCLSNTMQPQTFSEIYALTLPVLVPASDMPMVLRSMHHVLRPQGSLHLVLIDPMPVESTMGPRMWTWLENHLLANLEQQYRCTKPTDNFVAWLRGAHFQVGPGAKVVSRFRAVVVPEAMDEPERTDAKGKGKERAVDADGYGDMSEALQWQLHSLVGQKLWQEMWGSYVTADQWWWEDVHCREECMRLGTTWEYHILDAVKKSMAPGGQL